MLILVRIMWHLVLASDCDYYFPGMIVISYGLVGGGSKPEDMSPGAFRLSISRVPSRQSEVLGACLHIMIVTVYPASRGELL